MILVETTSSEVEPFKEIPDPIPGLKVFDEGLALRQGEEPVTMVEYILWFDIVVTSDFVDGEFV